MPVVRNIETGSGLQGLPHFLQQQQLRKTGVEPPGDTTVIPPVQRRECRAGPLTRAKTVKGLTAPIAEVLALRMDAATEVRLKKLTGLAAQLVMAELVGTLKGESSAAKTNTFAAVGREDDVVHGPPGGRNADSMKTTKAPAFDAGAFEFWICGEIVCFWQTLQ